MSIYSIGQVPPFMTIVVTGILDDHVPESASPVNVIAEQENPHPISQTQPILSSHSYLAIIFEPVGHSSKHEAKIPTGRSNIPSIPPKIIISFLISSTKVPVLASKVIFFGID